MIIGTVILSSRPEPFLAPCLESVKDAVDLLVVNDNSGQADHKNLEILRASQLYKEGKVKILQTKFEGFGQARNQYLDYIKKANLHDSWLLKLDTDEVHTKALIIITRKILPALSSKTGIVDTFFYQFMQSFDYIYSIDRRHNLLVRYNPELRWKHKVHEELSGIKGQRIMLPYAFFHYGYVAPKGDILDKWKLYAKCGDKSFNQLEQVELKHFLNWEARFCFRFNKSHPEAMREYLKEMRVERAEEFEKYRKVIREYQKKNSLKFKNYLRAVNYNLKINLQILETQLRFLFNSGTRRALSQMQKIES